MPRVNVNIEKLAAFLVLNGRIYVTVRELAQILGISTRTAGRILAEMERRGYAQRWSKRAYKLVARAIAEV